MVAKYVLMHVDLIKVQQFGCLPSMTPMMYMWLPHGRGNPTS